MPLPLQTTKAFSPRQQEKMIGYDLFPHGINRNLTAKQLQKTELVECLNFMYDNTMRLVSRPGLVKYSTYPTQAGAPIQFIIGVNVNLTGYVYDKYTYDMNLTYGGTDSQLQSVLMMADSNYKLYYLDGTNIRPVATNYTAMGKPYIVPFGGYAVVMDGSYLKYWDGTSFNLCYDYGTGLAGYLFDNTAAATTSTQTLYSGSVVKVASVFTTPAFDAGFTLPALSVSAVLSKSGSPTGNVYARLYATSTGAPTGSALASATLPIDIATGITATATKYDFAFTKTNTYAMAPSTTYCITIEYSGGDSGNYLIVNQNTVASGGTGYTYTGTTWTATSTKTPRYAFQPGLPPKGDFGCVWQDRMWFVSPDNPGWYRYSNVNSIFDYSTPNGGGYIGSIDSDGKSFPIGALIPLYGNLYVIGRKEAPYISALSGTSLSNYTQSVVLQTVSASQRSTVSTGNDIWLSEKSGVFNIQGVQAYGDIRLNSPGNPISSLLGLYFDDDAFGCYNPIDSQYWLKMTGYTLILIGHPDLPSKLGSEVRYPWTEYLIANITPTAFGAFQETFYIGSIDGHLYTLTSDFLDDVYVPTFTLETGILESPFGSTLVKEVFISIASSAVGVFQIDFYKDGSASSLLSKSFTYQTARVSAPLQFQFRSLQFKLSAFGMSKPCNIGEIYLKTIPLEAR
jgi:hypothetical protein